MIKDATANGPGRQRPAAFRPTFAGAKGISQQQIPMDKPDARDFFIELSTQVTYGSLNGSGCKTMLFRMLNIAVTAIGWRAF
jgi:hypothetical protein